MIKPLAVIVLMLAATAVSCTPPTAAPHNASDPVSAPDGGGRKGIAVGDLDRTVDPCTDFYEFANGTWRSRHPIPDALPRWSRRLATREANKQALRDLLEGLAAKRDAPAGSIEQQLGDYYASCTDEAAVEAAGLTPLAPLLGEIERARTPADVQRAIRRLHDIAIAVPFGVTGDLDYHEPTQFTASIVAGGLGMPDRAYYLGTEPRQLEIRDGYRRHIANVLALGGLATAPATDAADQIFALETRLAEASLNPGKAADPAATDHKMTFARLTQLAPHIDWNRYFDEAKLARVELNVAEPPFLEQLDKELATTPIATWKAYLTWHLLAAASPWLGRRFVDESFGFTDRLLTGATEPRPRAQRCVESTEALLGGPLGKKYVERHFSPAAKAKVLSIIRNLVAVLRADVAAVTYMTPAAKQTALAKIAAYNPQVGYPDAWKDYSAIAIRRDALWANVAAARSFNVRDNRAQVGHPSDPNLWRLSAASSDAYLDLQLNEIVLPAGSLQPPSFDLDANDAVNYGAVGFGVAHDITHAIDALGAENDLQGRPLPWWTPADARQFAERSQCVVDQYEGYFVEPGVEPGLHHDGKRVLGEALGDLRGLHMVYTALGRSMAQHPVPIVDGFTPEQQLFISIGQYRGDAMRPEAQRKLVAGDPHPTPRFRVIGPLSSFPEFQRAFACKAGAAMVRPADKRCTAW